MIDSDVFSNTSRWRLPRVIASLAFLIWASVGYALSFPDEPIAYIGHGVFFDKAGKPIEVTPEFVERTQAYYLKRLYEEGNNEQKNDWIQQGCATRLITNGIDKTKCLFKQRYWMFIWMR